MGIKGVYGEIGSGTRIALSKLAVEKREQHNANLRIAVDFSIWQHQVQLGKGGTNADLRTLFFRLLRFLRLSIEPLFVFDGPHKPPFKRNKKTNVSGGSALQLAAREFFDLLGFPYITAPGEAEAECALLQREGVVDAVLSEDVDTLMFGCTTHLRVWGPEDRKMKGGTATHVDMYKASEIKTGSSGLDREGLVLVALMNGGDYLPAGIPSCGIKIACEAARAGFGHDLQRINRNDHLALRAWRDRLQHELRTNESNYFRTKHRTLEIPETFPDKAVLYYYSNPVVSTSSQVEKYRSELRWNKPDIKQLRKACMVSFEWSGITGFRHFTRNIAPALVGWRLANGACQTDSYDDIDVQSSAEESLVKSISGIRTHASSGNISELRIAYIPQEVIGITLEDAAKDDLASAHDHTASYSDDEQEIETIDTKEAGDAAKKRAVLPYDPSKIEKQWFPKAYVKLGIPISYEKWTAEQQDPKKFATRKARAREKEKAVMPKGAIEKYLQVKDLGTKVSQNHDTMRSQRTESPHPNNVSFSSNPSLDHDLTKLDPTASSIITSTKSKAIPRPKSSVNKTTKTTASLVRHTRVTKPKSGASTSTFEKVTEESLDQEFVGQRQGLAEVASQSNVSGFCDSGASEITRMTDLSDRGNQLPSEVASSSQFKARPNHNQWRSIDDEDIIYKTPAPRKNTVTYIDLTLS